MKISPGALAAATILIWSTAVPVARSLQGKLDPGDPAQAVLFLAVLIVSAFVFFLARTVATHRRLPAMAVFHRRVPMLRWVAAQAIVLPLYLYCYYRALLTGPQVEMHTIIYSWPILMVVAIALLRLPSGKPETLPTAPAFLILITAAFSTIYMLTGKLSSVEMSMPALFALLAAILIGVTFAITAGALQRNADATIADNGEFYALATGTAALFPLAALLLVPRSIFPDFPYWQTMWLGGAVFGAGHLLWTLALDSRRLEAFGKSAEDIAILSYFTPVASAALLFLLFGTPLLASTVVGMAVVIVCSIMLNSRAGPMRAHFLGILGGLSAAFIVTLGPQGAGAASAVSQLSITGLLFLFGLLLTFFMGQLASYNERLEGLFVDLCEKIADSRRVGGIDMEVLASLLEATKHVYINRNRRRLHETSRVGGIREHLAALEAHGATAPALAVARSTRDFLRQLSRRAVPENQFLLLWVLGALVVVQSSLNAGNLIYERVANVALSGGIFYVIGILREGHVGEHDDRHLDHYLPLDEKPDASARTTLLGEILLVLVTLVVLFR